MTVNLTRIYTRLGDGGETHLGDMSRVPKTHPRIEAYGTVDELNAQLGVALTAPDLPEPATPTGCAACRTTCSTSAPTSRCPRGGERERLRVAPEQTDWLEARCDEVNATLEPLKSFVLPGGTPAAAHLHVCRTVCRRAERRAIACGDELNPEVVRYLNRLSDLLFILARAREPRRRAAVGAGPPAATTRGAQRAAARAASAAASVAPERGDRERRRPRTTCDAARGASVARRAAIASAPAARTATGRQRVARARQRRAASRPRPARSGQRTAAAHSAATPSAVHSVATRKPPSTSLGKCQARTRSSSRRRRRRAAPSAATSGRQRAGATSTAQSASDIAAVACPLGHDAAVDRGRPRAARQARVGERGLSSCVVEFAPSRISGTAAAVRGRPRHSAIATSAAPATTNGCGSASRPTRVAT